MVRIWAKTISNEKIRKDFVLEKEEPFSIVNFVDYVQEICEHMDIPTPVILKYHLKNYFDFNNAKFLSTDFIEHVGFDFLTLENAFVTENA